MPVWSIIFDNVDLTILSFSMELPIICSNMARRLLIARDSFAILEAGNPFIERKWLHFSRFDLIDEDLKLGLQAARRGANLVEGAVLTARLSSFRGLACLKEHPQIVLAGVDTKQRNVMIRLMESGSLAERNRLKSATDLFRLAIAIADPAEFADFLCCTTAP